MALGTATIGHFFVYLRRNVLVADVLLNHLVATGFAVFYLTLPLNHKQSLLTAERRLLLQGYYVLNLGVLYACNDCFFHILLQNYKKSVKSV